MKPALGRDIEEKVAKWLETQGKKVIRQRGDASFDLLVNGKKIDPQSYDEFKSIIDEAAKKQS